LGKELIARTDGTGIQSALVPRCRTARFACDLGSLSLRSGTAVSIAVAPARKISVRIVRFISPEQGPAYGLLQEDVVYALDGTLYARPRPGRPVGSPGALRLLAPCEPSKIIAIGRNYREHAAEHGAEVPTEPLVFLKPTSSIIGHEAPIVLPPQSNRVEHEAELVAVIGRRGRHIDRKSAWDYLLGFTCGNDVTARDLQRSDGQWARSKGFDTFCPLGPWIETDLDATSVDIVARVDGETRQRGNTRDMVHDLPSLISYVSSVMTLEPGDVILTGTPAGVAPLRPGEVVEVEVQGIGVLRNPVVAQ
jgi:2-keto-4-pentenoate hydratase/2-oxohepta-3-ene-1,7-dioic acid hydratase in catechol pathway